MRSSVSARSPKIVRDAGHAGQASSVRERSIRSAIQAANASLPPDRMSKPRSAVVAGSSRTSFFRNRISPGARSAVPTHSNILAAAYQASPSTNAPAETVSPRSLPAR